MSSAGGALCVVHVQQVNGYWLVGIGPATWQAADTEAELYRSARSARRAAVALAERTGLLVAPPVVTPARRPAE